MKYKIKIHSFIDLITNSSTEIYIQASEKTIQSVTEIINNILEMGGSNLRAQDLFIISLDKEGGEYNSNVLLEVKPQDENSELAKTTAKLLSNLTNLFSIDGEYNG